LVCGVVMWCGDVMCNVMCAGEAGRVTQPAGDVMWCYVSMLFIHF